MQGYDFTRDKVLNLIELGYIPEQPRPESGVIVDFLRANLDAYDRFSFSVRVGAGQTANAEFDAGTQRMQEFVTKKRIDCVAWSGQQPTIVEAKIRISPDLIGKLIMYRHLFVEELPDGPEPHLVGIGRFVDPEVERVASAQGIELRVYEAA